MLKQEKQAVELGKRAQAGHVFNRKKEFPLSESKHYSDASSVN